MTYIEIHKLRSLTGPLYQVMFCPSVPCKQSFDILWIKPKLRSIKKYKPSSKDTLPGSKIGGYTSSLKTSSRNPRPRSKFYIGTHNLEDLIPGVYILPEFPPPGGGKNQSILMCREENQTNLVIES